MHDLQPDILFISITLVENIKSAERQIHKIHQKYNSRLPVVVGGSALNKMDKNQEDRINAFIMKNASFDDITNLVKATIYNKT
jgi:hypothetical protein